MSNEAITKVGYVGMGIMGAPMAANLMKAGYELIVWNRTADKANPLADAGATVADTPADVGAKGAQVIFTNVTDTPDVEAAWATVYGVLAGVMCEAAASQA